MYLLWNKITNKWLGEEGTIGCHPFYFVVPCFIYCTEQRNYSSHKNAKKHPEMAWQYNVSNARADSEILKMGGALCPPPWLDDEENFGFQMVLKKILAKYFFQYFQVFSIFISNESLPDF